MGFLCWKNVSSFCKCKSYSHFFSKNIGIYAIFNDQSFNDSLTNDIVSCEQLGPNCISSWVHWFTFYYTIRSLSRGQYLTNICITSICEYIAYTTAIFKIYHRDGAIRYEDSVGVKRNLITYRNVFWLCERYTSLTELRWDGFKQKILIFFFSYLQDTH